jgi:preprotein translocase subunit SecA
LVDTASDAWRKAEGIAGSVDFDIAPQENGTCVVSISLDGRKSEYVYEKTAGKDVESTITTGQPVVNEGRNMSKANRSWAAGISFAAGAAATAAAISLFSLTVGLVAGVLVFAPFIIYGLESFIINRARVAGDNTADVDRRLLTLLSNISPADRKLIEVDANLPGSVAARYVPGKTAADGRIHVNLALLEDMKTRAPRLFPWMLQMIIRHEKRHARVPSEFLNTLGDIFAAIPAWVVTWGAEVQPIVIAEPSAQPKSGASSSSTEQQPAPQEPQTPQVKADQTAPAAQSPAATGAPRKWSRSVDSKDGKALSKKQIEDKLKEFFKGVVGKERWNEEQWKDQQVSLAENVNEEKVVELATSGGKTFGFILAAIWKLQQYRKRGKKNGVLLFSANNELVKKDSKFSGPALSQFNVRVARLITDDEGKKTEIYDAEAGDWVSAEKYVTLPESAAGMDEAQQRALLVELARKYAYENCDILQATVAEIGWDAENDELAVDAKDQAFSSRKWFGLFDEAHSTLGIEAQSPLVLSGMLRENAGAQVNLVGIVNELARTYNNNPDGLIIEDTEVRAIKLTGKGRAFIRDQLGKAKEEGKPAASLDEELWFEAFVTALKAYRFYERDKQYSVKNGKIEIIEGETGRFGFGRRYSRGLGAALEAKEGLPVDPERYTGVEMTIPSLLKRLDGWGAAMGKGDYGLFHRIYRKSIVVIKALFRAAPAFLGRTLYRTAAEKNDALVGGIKEVHGQGKSSLVVKVASPGDADELLVRLIRELDLVKEGSLEEKLLADYDSAQAALRKAEQASDSEKAAARVEVEKALDSIKAAMKNLDIASGKTIIRTVDARNEAELQDIRDLLGKSPKVIAIVTNIGGIGLDLRINKESATAPEKITAFSAYCDESELTDFQFMSRVGRAGDQGDYRAYWSLEDGIFTEDPTTAEEIKKYFTRKMHSRNSLKIGEDDANIEYLRNIKNDGRIRAIERLQKKDDLLQEKRKDFLSVRQYIMAAGIYDALLESLPADVREYVARKADAKLQQELKESSLRYLDYRWGEFLSNASETYNRLQEIASSNRFLQQIAQFVAYPLFKAILDRAPSLVTPPFYTLFLPKNHP